MDEQLHSESGRGIHCHNVTVLLSSNVTKGNDQIFMPIKINMAKLKKKGKGQFVNSVEFNINMSEEDVKRRLVSHFPNLENQIFFCASAVDKGTRLEFHGEKSVWDGEFMKKTLKGNSALYVFTEMTDSEWSASTLPQGPTVHTQSRHFADKTSGKRKNDESHPAAKRSKEDCVTVAPPFCNTRTPILIYPVEMVQIEPQGHPSTSTGTMAQNRVSSQKVYVSQSSRTTGLIKYSPPVTHTITSSTFVPGQQTQASGGTLPSTPTPVSPYLVYLQTSAVGKDSSQLGNRIPIRNLPELRKQTQTGLDQYVLQNKSGLLLGTSQSAGSSNIASRYGGTSLHSATQQRRGDQEQSYKPEVTVPEVTLQPGNIINGGPVSAFPTTGSQCDLTASVAETPGIVTINNDVRSSVEPSLSQRSPFTCLADNTAGGQTPLNTQASEANFTEQAGDQIFQNVQASGASLVEPGILYIDPSQQPGATADQQPISHESDSGWDSIRSNALGVAEASDTAEQSGDISSLSEIFGPSEDLDSALEEGREAWFDFLTQSSGVVDEIIPSQGPTEKNIRFCIILGEKLHRKYETSNLQAKFEGIVTVPLQKKDEKTLTGNIESCVAGKVKVYLECEGSDERSIGSTDFEFTKNKDQVILEKLSKVEMGQDELFKTFGTLAGTFLSRSRDVQQATPRGGGTGSSNVNKRNDAILEKILTLLVYKAAEIDGRAFLEMVFSTSAGRLVFNHYRNSSTSPGDVARANGHTILGDFLEVVNERLSKEVCNEDSYETVDWLELKHAVEKKVCPPGTDAAKSASSPDDNVYQSDYEADDEASPLPSPADTEANASEMDDSEHGNTWQISLGENDSCDSIATGAERQRHLTGNERQAGIESSFTNRDDTEKKMESLPYGTEAVENVASHPNQEGADPAEDPIVSSAVFIVAGETSNATELGRESGTNNSAKCQNQKAREVMIIVLPCEMNTGTLVGSYKQTTIKNTVWKRSCDEIDQKEKQDNLENMLSKIGHNQGVADPANDQIVTSAFSTVGGVPQNYTERGSGVGKSSRAPRHVHELIADIPEVTPWGESEERLMGPFTQYIQTKRENNLWERFRDKKDQEEELDNHEKLLVPSANQSSSPINSEGDHRVPKKVGDVSPGNTFVLKMCQRKLAERSKGTAKEVIPLWFTLCAVEMDDIYTRLHQIPAGSSWSELNDNTDVFSEKENGLPSNRILLHWQTGIGKRVFVKKVAIDWAEPTWVKLTEKAISEKCKFVVYTDLTKEPKQQSLRDVISASHIFAEEETAKKDSLLSYFIKHQDKGLLIKDGNDEYNYRSNSEIFEIFRDKLWNSCALITIRIVEADELKEFQDLYAEISEEERKVVCTDLTKDPKQENLGDVISASHIFVEEVTAMKDRLLSYITKLQDKVLLIPGGCYRSNPEIFEKVKRYKLRQCCYVGTTRIPEADKLKEFQDLYAEINEEERKALMIRILGGETEAQELSYHLHQQGVEALASIPLLLFKFCQMWRHGKVQSFSGSKTNLYLAIVRYVLFYNEGKCSPAKFRKVEDFTGILAEIGNVALECLLRDDYVFEYDQVSDAILCEESRIIGLLKVSKCTKRLRPAVTVSFIHKSIQEFLAAWYITHRCVPEGNLGEIGACAQTLDDCISLENIFQFVGGLSDDGAVRVSEHLTSVRFSDPRLNFSETVNEQCVVSLFDVTHKQFCFIDLVHSTFGEVPSKTGCLRHYLNCTDGIIFVEKDGRSFFDMVPEEKIWNEIPLRGVVWLGRWDCDEIRKIYQSLAFLNCLHIPLKPTVHSASVSVGTFLKQFEAIECGVLSCELGCMLLFHASQTQFHVRELKLCCGGHARLLADVNSPSSLSSVCSPPSCLEFLTSLDIYLHVETKQCSSTVTNIFSATESAFDLVEQIPNPGKCRLKLDIGVCSLTSSEAVTLAGLSPKLNNFVRLDLDLAGCCTAVVNELVSFITPKALKELLLWNMRLTPSAATALGRSLPEMSSLETLWLTGRMGSTLRVEELESLFGGFNRTFPALKCLLLSSFMLRGCLTPLTECFHFFPSLSSVDLSDSNLDEYDLRSLVDSLKSSPNLVSLFLLGNPLGNGYRVNSIVKQALPQVDLNYW